MAEEARGHARHTRRKTARGSPEHHHWHHRQLSEPAAAPACCCDTALQYEVLVGAATLQAASSAAALLTAQLPQIVTSAPPGSCLVQASQPGVTCLTAPQLYFHDAGQVSTHMLGCRYRKSSTLCLMGQNNIMQCIA